MLFDILTLFPEMFPSVLGASIFGRAAEAGHVSVRLHNIRHYATDKHHTADDYPFNPVARAWQQVVAWFDYLY